MKSPKNKQKRKIENPQNEHMKKPGKGTHGKTEKNTKFQNLPTKYFIRKNICFTSRPKNEKPEKQKTNEKWKNEKMEKLMFLSGTLPAGAFFMKNSISRNRCCLTQNKTKRLKNCPIRSGIKFCIDPIFVASELI